MTKPQIKVQHFIAEGIQHNWEVYFDGMLVGYVHCEGNGEHFGGSFPGCDQFDSDDTWDKIQELCFSDLADLYLIDHMEEMGY